MPALGVILLILVAPEAIVFEYRAVTRNASNLFGLKRRKSHPQKSSAINNEMINSCLRPNVYLLLVYDKLFYDRVIPTHPRPPVQNHWLFAFPVRNQFWFLSAMIALQPDILPKIDSINWNMISNSRSCQSEFVTLYFDVTAFTGSALFPASIHPGPNKIDPMEGFSKQMQPIFSMQWRCADSKSSVWNARWNSSSPRSYGSDDP